MERERRGGGGRRCGLQGLEPPHNFGAQSNEIISHMNTFKPQNK